MRVLKIILSILFLSVCFADMEFDGTDDYISLGVIVPPSSGTVMAWVYGDASATNADLIMTQWGADTQRAWELAVDYSSSQEEIRGFISTDGSAFTEVGGTATTVFPTEEWHHVAMTWDGTTAKVFLDGSQVGSDTSVGSPYTSAGVDNQIGNRPDINTITYYGKLTDVAYWNTDLTASEILSIVNSKVKGFILQIQPASLIGYWPLDDEEEGTSGDADTFLDQSGSGNDGTGNDGANNTGFTARANVLLSYP